MLLALASAFMACSPSADQPNMRDADVGPGAPSDAGDAKDRSVESMDASADGSFAAADGANDGAYLDVPDDAADGTSCLDVFGPIYMPDADDFTACTASTPCRDGLICSGSSCDERWECVTHARHPCPMDVVPHCGCDGVTFQSPPGCPERPYLHIGACHDGTKCDPMDLRCSHQEPDCPEGMLVSIENGIYGPCVPFSSCRCEFVWECPQREKYKCDRATWRCVELPER